jgi:hypothetical protein
VLIAAEGVNLTVTVQVAEFTSVPVHVFADAAKSDPFVPVKVVLVKVIEPPLEFVSVVDMPGLVTCCRTVPNASDPGANAIPAPPISGCGYV